MEFGCPVCNGLMTIGEFCSTCEQVMEDMGRIEDYYTPYSPYEEQDGITILQESNQNCIHLFQCLGCGMDKNVLIPLEYLT